MLSVSALVAAIILPPAGKGAWNNLRLADRSLQTGEDGYAEAQYRALLHQAAPPLVRADGSVPDPTFSGNAVSIRFPAESAASTVCSGATGYTIVRLRIEAQGRGGRLICEGAAGRSQLLAWESGKAHFSFSVDGVAWIDRWPPLHSRRAVLGRFRKATEPQGLPLVRLWLPAGPGEKRVWIERIGDPALGDPSISPWGDSIASRMESGL